ncbi:MAG: cation:proton antiporter [Bdellovibrionales bacterium]|nr:cation:proton antiporter [Bdellovibrionales bacterium]
MTHIPPLLRDLAYILITAGFASILFRKIRQPIAIGYLISGFLVGPNFTFSPSVVEPQTIKLWAEIGVVFLLFALGLEFNFKKLAKVGLPAAITSCIEIAFIFSLSFLVTSLLGWRTEHKVFLAGMLSISSTTIIFRSFEELNLKSRSFAQLVFGILIFEDLFAILLLVLLPAYAASKNFGGTELFINLFKMGFFILLWFLLGIFLLPSIFRKIRTYLDAEITVLLSTGLCFFMVVVSNYAGYSAELGAFVMGSLLSETGEREKIEKYFHPLKSLFGAIFFVSIGMLINPDTISNNLGIVSILFVTLIVGKIFGVLMGAIISGQKPQNALHASFSMAQIGEFSFIIATLGLTLNILDETIFPIIVAVSIISTFTTPYLIKSSFIITQSLKNSIPIRLQNSLDAYSRSLYMFSFQQSWISFLKKSFVYFSIYTTIILFIFFALAKIQPYIGVNRYFAWGIALLISSPFIWALTLKPIEENLPQPLLRTLRLLRYIFSLLFILILSTLFLPLQTSLLLLLATSFFTFWKFSARLQDTYGWYENRFLSNYSNETASPKPVITPWDIHISEFTVVPQAKIVGKTISELNVREKYGVTIASLKRGDAILIAPTSNERIYPHDTLYLIGGDQEILYFQNSLLLAPLSSESDTVQDQNLKKFVVDKDSPLLGTQIKDSNIRDKHKGIIIGVERAGERILNPPATFVINEGDLIWVLSQSNA